MLPAASYIFVNDAVNDVFESNSVGGSVNLMHSTNTAFQRNQVQGNLNAINADYDTVADMMVNTVSSGSGSIQLFNVYNSTITDDVIADYGVDLATDWNVDLTHNVINAAHKGMGVIQSNGLVVQQNNLQSGLDIDGGAQQACCAATAYRIFACFYCPSLFRAVERWSRAAPLPKQWWTCPS